MCNDFARGTCKRGDSCRYSHIGAPPSSAGGSSGYGSGYGGGGGGFKNAPQAGASDDWQCDGCGNSNFQWRKACKRCGAPKSKAVKDAEQKAAAGWLHAGLRDTSNRIFVQGFDPITTSEDDLKELFSGIGVIARVRQRFGFPDQWPHAVKIYRDASTGKAKDEAVIKYDDPMAAQSAPGFYDGYELKGKKLSVSIATSREDREGGGRGDGGGDRGNRGDRGGGGGGRGYDDRRGGYDDRRGATAGTTTGGGRPRVRRPAGRRPAQAVLISTRDFRYLPRARFR